MKNSLEKLGLRICFSAKPKNFTKEIQVTGTQVLGKCIVLTKYESVELFFFLLVLFALMKRTLVKGMEFEIVTFFCIINSLERVGGD